MLYTITISSQKSKYHKVMMKQYKKYLFPEMALKETAHTARQQITPSNGNKQRRYKMQNTFKLYISHHLSSL